MGIPQTAGRESGTRDWLRGQWARTCATLSETRQASQLALRDALDIREAARNIINESRVTRARSRPLRRSFSLEGYVDGEAVFAWIRDGEVFASRSLLARADLVSRMGDRVPAVEGDGAVPAGLTGPAWAVMVTLIRACDRAVTIELTPGPGDLARTSPGHVTGAVPLPAL